MVCRSTPSRRKSVATRRIVAGSSRKSLSTAASLRKHRSSGVQADGENIKDAGGRIAAVVVTKLDQLTRSLRDLLTINEDLLEPCGCNFVAIRDGINTFEPVSKMLLPFLAIIGQIERQNTSERVKSTVRHIQQQGGTMGKSRLVSARCKMAGCGVSSKIRNNFPGYRRSTTGIAAESEWRKLRSD